MIANWELSKFLAIIQPESTHTNEIYINSNALQIRIYKFGEKNCGFSFSRRANDS